MTTSMTSYLPFKKLDKEPCPALAQRDGGIFDFMEVWPDEHPLKKITQSKSASIDIRLS